MTDREAQIEALWTYEISTEKVLRRAVKKGFITQAEAECFSAIAIQSKSIANCPVELTQAELAGIYRKALGQEGVTV